jgi:endonuclease/exonuclease/phosphatase family metal-dependent hydrolase
MDPARRLRHLLITACLGVAAMLCVQPVRAQHLRVMSFNVRLLTDVDGPNQWRYRRDLAATMIRRQHPDVIGTQELVAGQGDDLVARLPHYAWFGEGRRGGRGDEHMGVFYRRDRLRVVESGNFWLSDTPEVPGSITWGNPFPRMVTWALFERIADHRRFYLFNTHLPYREGDVAARVHCVQAIRQRLRTLPKDIPVVVTGDFNNAPIGPVHDIMATDLQDAWIGAPRRQGPDATFHAFTGKPDHRIDWILFRGLKAVRAETVTTHRGALYPSDHFPVVAELRWPWP